MIHIEQNTKWRIRKGVKKLWTHITELTRLYQKTNLSSCSPKYSFYNTAYTGWRKALKNGATCCQNFQPESHFRQLKSIFMSRVCKGNFKILSLADSQENRILFPNKKPRCNNLVLCLNMTVSAVLPTTPVLLNGKKPTLKLTQMLENKALTLAVTAVSTV